MSTVVTFGEIMARFEAAPYKRFSQVMPGSLEVTFAGAEANVAAGLVALGEDARFVTVLPDNPLGHACEAELRAVGIDCSAVLTSADGRLGLYFIEHGANQRSSHVLYDRIGSSVAVCDPARYRWDEIFGDAAWFHITGITPAISRQAATASLESVKAAKDAGVPVSVDLNFRSKLWRWSPERDPKQLAGETMAEIVAFADVLVANEADTSDVFGIEGGSTDVERGKLDTEGYRSVASQLTRRFPSLSKIAITLRESVSASYNRWGAMVYDAAGDQFVFAPRDESGAYAPHEIRNIVDRVGAGDSFAAALIHAVRDPELSESLESIADFAVAASALCHSIHGDFNRVSKEEILALMGGIGSGRVRR
ncbi:MAG: PfkB family carbohydrate kinase [Spirochaetaceae bacterium]